MAKGGLRDQARGWSTKPAAQARTELGLAAQGGRRDLWRQACPSPHSSPPHRRQRARGPQMPPSQSHTHTQRHRQEHGTHAWTRGRKAVEDRRCRHLLRNAECTRGHTPNTPPQPATHFIQAAADMPHTSKHHRGTHTHGNHDKTHTQAPPHGLAHTGSSSNLLDSRDPTPGTARKSLVSGTATISIQPRHWKCPPRSQAQPSPPLPQAATAGANTSQQGSLSALQLPSLCHLPSEAPKGDAALPAKHGCSRKAPGPSDVPGAVGKRATAQPGRWGHRRRAGHAVRHLPHRLPPNPSTSCG